MNRKSIWENIQQVECRFHILKHTHTHVKTKGSSRRVYECIMLSGARLLHIFTYNYLWCIIALIAYTIAYIEHINTVHMYTVKYLSQNQPNVFRSYTYMRRMCKELRARWEQYRTVGRCDRISQPCPRYPVHSVVGIACIHRNRKSVNLN